MEKYGFVYIWYNKKSKMFYIGSHWGTENDGYICSSTWMRNTYNRHKENFKRRIIKRIYTNKKNLTMEENRYLSMINESELGKKYYNLRNHNFGHWSHDEIKAKLVIEKFSNSNKGRIPWNKGIEYSDDLCIKMRKPKTEDHKQKISESQKGHISPKKGKPANYTDEVKFKIGSPWRGKKQSNEFVEKRMNKIRGMRWVTDGIINKKVRPEELINLDKSFRIGRTLQ